MFPCLRPNKTFLGETFFVSEKQKLFLIFSEKFCFYNRFPAEETTLTGFCGRVGCVSKIEHARSAVFSEKVVGLPGKETMFPARLSAQETFWETMFPHATMFPRLRGPLKCI